MKNAIFTLSGSLASALILSACVPNLDPNHSGDVYKSNAGYFKAERFIGSPAVSNPLAATTIPNHPFLAEQGRNGMHSDSYSTGTYATAGPLGNNPSVTSKSFGLIGGECATAVFNTAGQLISVCTDFTTMRLVLLHPDTLAILAQHELPLRASNKTLNIEKILTDTSSGAYFHLMNGDRPLIANADNHIQIFSVSGNSWNIDKDYDITPYLAEGATITDAIPDFSGNIWFLTRQGIVGVIDANTEEIQTMQLPTGEEVQNSLSVAADGVFIVSDHAMYRFEQDGSNMPVTTWREAYDRGSSTKPGSITQGSGTTPALMDLPAGKLIAISDNADNRINVEVYRREDSFVGTRKICSVPVFTPGASVTENSFIAYDHSIMVENNYGYKTPFDPVWTEPGITRIDVRPDLSGCDIVWENTIEASQTTVPKLSKGNGLIYLYTREKTEKIFGFNVGLKIDAGGDNSNFDLKTMFDDELFPAQAWYLTAIDFQTGDAVYKIFTGTGNGFNNNWAPITIGPNGTAYVGVLNGMIAVKDN